jgi:hypothetical protein
MTNVRWHTFKRHIREWCGIGIPEHLVGIAIRPGYIQASVVHVDTGTLVSWASVLTPQGAVLDQTWMEPDLLVTALTTLRQNLNLKEQSLAVVGYPSQGILYRPIDVPLFLSQRQTAAVIHTKVQQKSPVLFDFFPVSQSQKMRTLLTAIAPKNLIEQRQSVLQKAGFVCYAMDVEESAWLAFLEGRFLETIYLHIDTHHTLIVVMNHQWIADVRYVPIGFLTLLPDALQQEPMQWRFTDSTFATWLEGIQPMVQWKSKTVGYISGCVRLLDEHMVQLHPKITWLDPLDYLTGSHEVLAWRGFGGYYIESVGLLLRQLWTLR